MGAEAIEGLERTPMRVNLSLTDCDFCVHSTILNICVPSCTSAGENQILIIIKQTSSVCS